MKWSIPIALVATVSAATEVYPKTVSQVAPVAYQKNDVINDIQCIQRQIDTGEHKFDADSNIIYGEFPTCLETGKPLDLHFGQNTQFNCSFGLTDEIYHLFQLYMHEDTPFSCKIHDHKDKTGGFIPLTFNFRGNLEASHLDIDSKLNLVATYNKEDGAVKSIVAFGSGSSTSKYIIGDNITLEINNVWFETTDDEFYKINSNSGFSMWSVVFIVLVSSIVSGTILVWLLYGNLNKKALKLQSKDFGIEQSKYE